MKKYVVYYTGKKINKNLKLEKDFDPNYNEKNYLFDTKEEAENIKTKFEDFLEKNWKARCSYLFKIEKKEIQK